MRRPRVTMLKTVDSLEKGSSYNLPADLAEKLINDGAAHEEGKPPIKPTPKVVKPSQTKPAGPSERK